MNTIYYFTGTGNSLQIAQDIAEGLGDTKLIPVSDYKGELIQGETVGIIYPVYDWGIPLIIERFLKQAKIKSNAYLYAVTNFNGAPGKALIQCKEILEIRKIKLSAGFLIQMPGNYIPMYGAKSLERQQKLFTQEKKKVKEIIEKVKERKELKLEKKYPLLTKILFHKFYKQVANFPTNDKNFVLSEDCSGCGLCSKVCSVHNIEMINGKPNWQHHCEMCLGCLQYCPKRAIEYGTQSINRERYHNPNVKRVFE